jgi:hypothetical protein
MAQGALSITAAEALADYLAMGAERSISKLFRRYSESNLAKPPAEITLKWWSRRDHWVEQAREFDERVGRRLRARAETAAVRQSFNRVAALNTVAQRCLEVAAYSEIENATSAADIRALVTAAVDAIKLTEVLTGGVSDRIESARGIAAEARELLQKLERQKRAGITPQALPLNEENTDRSATFPRVLGNGPTVLAGESRARSAVPYAKRARAPS